MKIDTIKKLCCPFDKTDLALRAITADEQNNILEGILICSECSRIYPIVSGIPIMSPDEYRDYQLEQHTLENWVGYLNEKQEEQYQISNGKIKEVR